MTLDFIDGKALKRKLAIQHINCSSARQSSDGWEVFIEPRTSLTMSLEAQFIEARNAVLLLVQHTGKTKVKVHVRGLYLPALTSV